MTGSKDFTVAIVGGGMVGMMAAVALSRAGIKIDIYESAVRYPLPAKKKVAMTKYIF